MVTRPVESQRPMTLKACSEISMKGLMLQQSTRPFSRNVTKTKPKEKTGMP